MRIALTSVSSTIHAYVATGEQKKHTPNFLQVLETMGILFAIPMWVWRMWNFWCSAYAYTIASTTGWAHWTRNSKSQWILHADPEILQTIAK